MKELDVVLERYVRLHLPVSSQGERRVLESLLELPDPVLADYLLGPAILEPEMTSDPEMARMIAAIRGTAPQEALAHNVGKLPEL